MKQFTIKDLMSRAKLSESAARGLVTFLVENGQAKNVGVRKPEGQLKGKGANLYEVDVSNAQVATSLVLETLRTL